jgi:hypothetical protein
MTKATVLAAALAATAAGAVPSADTYPAVTNDWANAAFTNVYERAALRQAADSNDVVAAYLMFDWTLAFGDLAALSNAVTRVIAASDSVTNAAFAAVYGGVRPLCLAYRDEFLPLATAAELQAEQQKLRAAGARLANDFVLRLLWENGLW